VEKSSKCLKIFSFLQSKGGKVFLKVRVKDILKKFGISGK